MSHPALCDCCACTRVCVGHEDLTCLRIPYEFVGVNLTTESWIDLDIGSPVFFYSFYNTAKDGAGFHHHRHHPRYHEAATRPTAFYDGSTSTTVCAINAFVNYQSDLIKDPGNKWVTPYWCDNTSAGATYTRPTVEFAWMIRFRPDGDVDAMAYTRVVQAVSDFTGHIFNLSFGLNVYFHGVVTPPSGWIDSGTGLITSALTIPNQLGAIGSAWSRSANGYAPTPLGGTTLFQTGYDGAIEVGDELYDNWRVGGCGGDIIIRPDDSTFPAGWRDSGTTYPAGEITCDPMDFPAKTCGDDAGDDEPPGGDIPPYPPPWIPPGDRDNTALFAPVYNCPSPGTRSGFWINVDRIGDGTVFKRDGNCYYVELSEAVRRKRCPRHPSIPHGVL